MSRTDDVLDAIDGAIRDRETSGDAMRWRPPEHQVIGPPAPTIADLADFYDLGRHEWVVR